MSCICLEFLTNLAVGWSNSLLTYSSDTDLCQLLFATWLHFLSFASLHNFIDLR